MSELEIRLIDGFGTRLRPDNDIDEMVKSLSLHGQLAPIRVRPHPTRASCYQVIFGDRRLAAAKLLGWKTIQAEVVKASDQDAMIMAFCENENRKDLCDYERAVELERIHKVTGKSYSEISELIGKSPAYVSQHIAMLNLFPESVGSKEEVDKVLCTLTENHARVLLKIDDLSDRWNTAKLAVRANLSVRELQKFCTRTDQSETKINKERDDEVIRQKIMGIIRGFNSRDMRPYVDSLSSKYFASFVVMPRFNKIDAEKAKSYVQKILAKVTSFYEALQSLDIRFFGNLAIATLELFVTASYRRNYAKIKFRASIIFQHDNAGWEIVHEHWSADDPRELESLFALDPEFQELTRHSVPSRQLLQTRPRI